MKRNHAYSYAFLALLGAITVPYLAHAMPKQAPTTSSPDQDNFSLILAAKTGNLDAIKKSLKSHANVNEQDKQGRTALMWASMQGHEDVAQELIQANPDFNVQDMLGMTALMWAILKKQTKIAVQLIKASTTTQANLNLQAKNSKTALMLAAEMDNIEVVKQLTIAQVDLEIEDKRGLRASDYATLENNMSVLLELVKAGALICADLRLSHETLLTYASRVGDLKAVQNLLQRGSDTSLLQIEPIKQPALMVAIDNENTDIALELIRAGADLHVTSSVGNTPLILASKMGNLTIVQELIKHNIDLNQKDHEVNPDTQRIFGKTALMWAINGEGFYGGHLEVAQALIEAKADIHAISKESKTALIYACSCAESPEELVFMDALIQHGVDLDQLTSPANPKLGSVHKLTAVRWAIAMGFTLAAKKLIEAGANLDATGDAQYLKLILASQEGDLDAVKTILEQISLEQTNTVSNAKIPGFITERALQFAIARNHMQVAIELIQADMEILKNNMRGTPLIWASQVGNIDITRKLIEHGVDLDQVDDAQKWTALIWAIVNRHTQVALALIHAGAHINMPDAAGHTPLAWAFGTQNLQVAEALLDKELDPSYTANTDNPIAGEALIKMVSRCHDQWNQDIKKATARQADRGCKQRVTQKLDYLAAADSIFESLDDMKHPPARNKTHSEQCTPSGCDEADHEADLDDHISYLNIKATLARTKLAPTTIDYMRAKQWTDEDGATVLMLASQTGNYEIVNQLLPRLTAEEINAQDKKGKTALMQAAERGHLNVVQCLLHAKADRTLKSNKGKTARQLVCGHKAIIDLLDGGSSPSQKVKPNQTRSKKRRKKNREKNLKMPSTGHDATKEKLPNKKKTKQDSTTKDTTQSGAIKETCNETTNQPKSTATTDTNKGSDQDHEPAGHDAIKGKLSNKEAINQDSTAKDTTQSGAIKETCNETTSQPKSTATTDTNKDSDQDHKKDTKTATHALLDNPTALIELLERQPDAMTENGRPVLIDIIIKSARAKSSAANYRTILQKIIGREELLKAQLHMLISTAKPGHTNLFHALALLDAKTDKNAKSIWHTLEQVAQNIDPLALTKCLNQTDENDNCPWKLAQHPETKSWLRKMGASDTHSLALAEKQQGDEQIHEDEEKSEKKGMPRVPDKHIIANDVHRAAQAGRSKELSSLIHRVLMQAQHPKAIVQQASRDGNTALHYAVLSMKPAAVRALTKSYTISQQPTTAKKSKKGKKGKKKRAKRPNQRTQQTVVQFNFDVKNGDGHTPLSLAQTILEGTAAGPLHDAMENIVSHLQKSGARALTHSESADTRSFDGSIAKLRSALQAQDTAQVEGLLRQHDDTRGSAASRLVTLKLTTTQTGSFGDSTSQFYTALQKRNHIQLQQLLQQKPGLANSQEPKSGMSALQCAVQANNIEATALLLSAGAAVDETIRSVTCKKLLANGMNTDIFVQLLLALSECERGFEQPGGSANPWDPFYTHVREHHFPVSLGGNRNPDKSRFTAQFLDSPRTHQTLVRLLRDAHTHLLQNPRCVQAKNLSEFIKSDFYPLTDREVGAHEAWCIPLHTTEAKVNIIAAIRDGKMRIVTAYPISATA